MTTLHERNRTKDEVVKLSCRQTYTVYMRQYVQQLEEH